MDEQLVTYAQAGRAPILFTSRWQKYFLAGVGILASTILLKFAAVQYLEWLYLFEIILLLLNFVHNDFYTRWFWPYLRLELMYGIFCVTAMALALASLRFTFYIPAGAPLLFQPIYVTVSRMTELILSVVVMISLADVFRKEPNKLRFTMRLYFWTGVLSTIYSYISYPLDVLDITSLGSYSSTHRFRGFYNEGGPYGLYLFTVIFVGFALWGLQWETRQRLRIGIALLPIAFAMSASKAAFSAMMALLLLNGIFASGIGRRFLILSGMVVMFVVASVTANFNPESLFTIGEGVDYEQASHLHPGDASFVYGRVAATFIVPRMIKAHPLTGIGWGNYGTLRNEPEYRGASYWAEIADVPGLGLLGYAAELGIPLLTFLFLCMFYPWLSLQRLRCPVWVSNLALLQPLVHIFGAQLNVTYPWVATAFALGLGYGLRGTQTQKLQAAAAPHRLSWEQPALPAEGLHG